MSISLSSSYCFVLHGTISITVLGMASPQPYNVLCLYAILEEFTHLKLWERIITSHPFFDNSNIGQI